MRQVISRFSPFGMTNHYTFVLDKIDAIKAAPTTTTTTAAAAASYCLHIAAAAVSIGAIALSSGIGKISP